MDTRTIAARRSPERPVRVLAVAAIAVAALAGGLSGAAPPAADAAGALPATERIAAPDRTHTAALVSEQAYPSGSDVAYLVTGEDFVDGLIAVPPAVAEGAPVLLTWRASLSFSTATELRRLDPSTVVIVGGLPSITAVVEEEVRAVVPSADVVRLAGRDRFETNRMAVERVFDAASNVFIVSGTRFPDGLAAGPAAAALDAPILIVDAQGQLDAASRALVDDLGATWAGLTGGEDAVSRALEDDLRAAGMEVRRFAGPDRFGTAAALADVIPDVDTVYIASGENFADVPAGASIAGAHGAALLLARRDCMPGHTLDALVFLEAQRVVLLGGEPTLSLATGAYERCG